MLRLISVVLACTAIVFPVFAQSQDQDNAAYVQNAQKMLNQSTAQAKKQYDKTYPKPVVPRIQSPMQSAEMGNTASPLPPPSPAKDNTAINTTNNSNYTYSNPGVQAAKPAPDIAIGMGSKNTSPSQNIFVPPGTDSNNKPAPNPYG